MQIIDIARARYYNINHHESGKIILRVQLT
mgnify:CR=1 FL=1